MSLESLVNYSFGFSVICMFEECFPYKEFMLLKELSLSQDMLSTSESTVMCWSSVFFKGVFFSFLVI